MSKNTILQETFIINLNIYVKKGKRALQGQTCKGQILLFGAHFTIYQQHNEIQPRKSGLSKIHDLEDLSRWQNMARQFIML